MEQTCAIVTKEGFNLHLGCHNMVQINYDLLSNEIDLSSKIYITWEKQSL